MILGLKLCVNSFTIVSLTYNTIVCAKFVMVSQGELFQNCTKRASDNLFLTFIVVVFFINPHVKRSLMFIVITWPFQALQFLASKLLIRQETLNGSLKLISYYFSNRIFEKLT